LKRIIGVAFILLLFCPLAIAQPVPQPAEIPPAYPVAEEIRALLDTAIAEIGVMEDKAGRTKYGEWYGEPNAEWCAEFLCWSVAQVEEDLGLKLLQERFPLYGATNIGREWFLKQGRYIARTGFIVNWGSQWYTGQDTQMEKNSYIPQPGDWAFFSYTPSGDTTHVAMVEKCLRNSQGGVIVQVIEGNNPDRVQRAQYKLDDWRIQGYGTVYELADIVLRGGIESNKVTKLQIQLIAIGLLQNGEAGGTYNLRTQEAVRAFQGMMRLSQSGIANQQTQLALNQYANEWMMSHTEFWTVDGAL
jgi:hypothetical protein